MTPQRLIMLAFFLQPIAFGAWLPRIPDIQQRLAIGPAELALALLGLPVGTLITLAFAGRLVGWVGARTAIRAGFVAFLIVVSLPAFAVSIHTLFLALLAVGIAMPVLELGLNVKADEVEKLSDKGIMNTCHGFWSLGMMTGSLVGAGLAGLQLAPQYAVPLVAVIVLPLALLATGALPDGHLRATPVPGMGGLKSFKLPGALLMGVCLFTFGIGMTEGAAADWSAVYLRDIFDAGSGAAGIAYSGFALMVSAGRFVGDAMKKRWGPVPVARFCVAAALVGILVIVTGPNYGVALVGFGLTGFGVSVGFPLAVTAAASVPDRPAASSVAFLSLTALFGFLVGPPLIGFVAQHLGLRFGLGMLMPGLVLSFILAGMLGRAQHQGRTSRLAQALPIGNGK